MFGNSWNSVEEKMLYGLNNTFITVYAVWRKEMSSKLYFISNFQTDE